MESSNVRYMETSVLGNFTFSRNVMGMAAGIVQGAGNTIYDLGKNVAMANKPINQSKFDESDFVMIDPEVDDKNLEKEVTNENNDPITLIETTETVRQSWAGFLGSWIPSMNMGTTSEIMQGAGNAIYDLSKSITVDKHMNQSAVGKNDYLEINNKIVDNKDDEVAVEEFNDSIVRHENIDDNEGKIGCNSRDNEVMVYESIAVGSEEVDLKFILEDESMESTFI